MASMADLVRTPKDKPSSKQTVRGTSRQSQPPQRQPSQQRSLAENRDEPSRLQPSRQPSQPRSLVENRDGPSRLQPERQASQPGSVRERGNTGHISQQARLPSQTHSLNQRVAVSQQQPGRFEQQGRLPSQSHSLDIPRQRDTFSVYHPASAPIKDDRSHYSPFKFNQNMHIPEQDDVIDSPVPISRLTNKSISGGLIQPIKTVTPLVPTGVKTPNEQKTPLTAGSKKTVAEIPVEEVDDIGDDREYSEYYYPEFWPQSQRSERIGPRVETSDSHEACKCFPHRSSKHVSSMLYEHVTCVHTGLKGQTHQGVFRFEDNWNPEYEVPTKVEKLEHPETRYVLGYPPVFEAASSDEYDEEEYEEDRNVTKVEDKKKSDKKQKDESKAKDANKNDDKQQKPSTSSSNKNVPNAKDTKRNNTNSNDNKNKGKQEIVDEYDDDSEEEFMELSRDEKYYPIRLPQIGYSPPQSREQSRMSTRSQAVLPKLPESPHLTNRDKVTKTNVPNKTKLRTPRDDDLRDDVSVLSGRRSKTESVRNNDVDESVRRRQIDRDRKFHGVYYDPVTKRSMEFNIQPKFRTSFRGWDAQLGDRVSGGNTNIGLPSRLSVIHSSRNTNRNIPEE